MSGLATQRRFFAEEIEALSNLQTPALVEALATVPREAFLPPGPWTIRSEADYLSGPMRRTPDADARRVYHNLAVAIDPERQLFNGAPSLLASFIERLAITPGERVLHVGCGLGYYSALMAHCVGPTGRVVAIDADDMFAAGARDRLAPLRQVEVRAGDGTAPAGESFDAILINAGMTHPHESWLDALAPGGRLILPLTATMPAMGPIGKGPLVLLTKQHDGFAARLVTVIAIYSAVGLRDEALNQQLGKAMMRGQMPMFNRLRRDAHEPSPSCWFHTDRCCFSA